MRSPKKISGRYQDSPARGGQRNEWIRQVAKVKRNGYLMRLTQQSGKREAKGEDKNRYKELKAEVQRKLRMDKQQQLEGVCMELEAANSKGNSRQLFQIVKSMTRKFHPRLQGIQSATGENLTEAAQIADR